jgi:hypothetical protein
MPPTDQDLSRAAWRKSTYSNNGGNCIEVTRAITDMVAVRDSADPEGSTLVFTPHQWTAFTSTLKG